MRAEYAAASTNFALVVLIAVGLTMASRDSNTAYPHPTKAVIQAVLMSALVAAPFAVFAFFRTWVHAQRWLRGETAGWRGVLEAGALGFAMTLPFVLPGVVVGQFNPGPGGQSGALVLGLAYTASYGLLGLAVGLGLGLALWLSAALVLLVHRRITS